MYILPRVFGSGSSRASVFPVVWEHQQVVFSHNALLCGVFEVKGAASVSVHRPLVVVSHSHLWSWI